MGKRIKIKSGISTKTAEFLNEDGTPIGGIRSCDIKMRVGEIVTATIGLSVDKITIEAEPLLSLATVEQTASHYGYELKPIEDGVK